MRSRLLSNLWYAGIVCTFVASFARLAYALPSCDDDGHGIQCVTPVGCGIVSKMEDTPNSCCYMIGTLCCKYIRWKYVYTEGCSKHNCSDCEGAPAPESGATCNTTTGYCDF